MKAFKIFVPVSRTNLNRDAVRMSYEGSVALELKADTSWSASSDILPDSQISISLGQIVPTKELHNRIYLVTVEEVHLNAKEHPSDGYKRITQEREEQELIRVGVSNDMIRRLKEVR